MANAVAVIDNAPPPPPTLHCNITNYVIERNADRVGPDTHTHTVRAPATHYVSHRATERENDTHSQHRP